MTITVTMTNPAEHQPSELRALALFFSNLAEDRESGRIAEMTVKVNIDVPDLRTVECSPKEVAAEPTPLPQTPEAGPAAASVSAPIAPPAPPAADVPPAPVTSPCVELDAQGLPWDGRIHSETKNRNADKTWRKKRGVDPALVIEVEARLRELVAIPAAPEQPPAAPVEPITWPPVTDAVPAAETVAPPVPVAPAAETVPPAPVADAAPTAPAAPAAVTVADVFKFASATEKNGTLSIEARTAALASVGFTSMVDLGTRPDMAAQVMETFKTYGASL